MQSWRGKKERGVKAKRQLPVGTLRPLEIHTRKWSLILVDFIMELFISGIKKNIDWVIMERLTKSAHFIPIHDTWGYNDIRTVVFQGTESI